MEEERIVSFIHSLDKDAPQILTEIEKEAKETDVPIIRKETQGLLRFLVASNRPESILEVGTATGFSALLMWVASERKAKITTIEKYEPRIPIARENFRRAGKEGQITLLEGDALEILQGMEGEFDFIFMDAAKAQYIYYMPEVVRLLAKDGVLISDNVLQDGDIIESRFAVERRNRTIHSRMREYLYELKHHKLLETSIIPLGDGVALSTKVREE